MVQKVKPYDSCKMHVSDGFKAERVLSWRLQTHSILLFLCNIGEEGGNACRLKMYSLHRAWGSKKKKKILIIVHELKCAKEAFEFPELLEGHI